MLILGRYENENRYTFLQTKGRKKPHFPGDMFHLNFSERESQEQTRLFELGQELKRKFFLAKEKNK
jgi:hypothetical protein